MYDMKRIVITLLCILIMLDASSCTKSNQVNSIEKTKDEALSYLNSLYDDTFSPVSHEGKSWAYDYESIYFSSQKYNDQIVSVYKDIADDTEFVDDYFKLRMDDEAEQYFLTFSTNVVKNIATKVHFSNQYRPTNIAADADFEEYLSSGEAHMDIYFFTNEEISIQDQQGIVSNIASQEKSYGGVTFITSEDSLDQIRSTKLDDLLSTTKYYVKRKDYLVSKDFTIKEYEERVY